MSEPRRKAGLHEGLPPSIGIDAGTRWTRIAVRIGGGQPSCSAARSVRNPATSRADRHPSFITVELDHERAPR